MSSYEVVIVDEDYDTHEFVASFTEPRPAYDKAEQIRQEMEEDGESWSLRVEVIEVP